MPRFVSFVAALQFGVVLLALPGAVLAATPPAMTNYQGVLRGPADEPLTGTYDMVFRFFDAETGGNEVLLDRHMTLNAMPVTVDGGLFSVALGGGLVVDGTGPGLYTSLADLFRDYSAVWLEVTIGAETLSPRTRVLATGYALNASTAATSGTATNASLLNGQPPTFYLDTSATRQVKDGGVRFQSADTNNYVLEAITQPGSPGAFWAQGANAGCVLATATNGAQCGGNSYGGYFYDANDSSYAYAGYNVYGLYSGGPTYGLYSQAWGSSGMGVFASAPQYGIYTTASGSAGIGLYSSGVTGAHFIQSNLPGPYTKIAYSGYGIMSQSYNGIHSIDYNDGGYARVGSSPYKIYGTGSVSFVQNHPADPDKVVVYHAPESSEVNVYTRGSAKLVKGVARVSLDPTFAWVANPDLGLTAHLTPRAQPVALAVESVSTNEIVVRGPDGSDVAFDYWVTGLRIGFEEMPPVKEKEIDSGIPPKASGSSVYTARPELRAYNALERYLTMSRDLGRNVDPERRASVALSNHIGHTRPTIVPDEARLPGGNAAQAVEPAPAEALQPPQPEPDRQATAAQPTAPAAPSASDRRPLDPRDSPLDPRPRSGERFQASAAIEVGDVVVIDPQVRGSVRRSVKEEDRTVVGVALTASVGGWVEVAMGAVVEVRADAGYGAIRAGDLLVSSPAPGAAMRARSAEAGTILGKALEPLESGLGTIHVLVMLR
jgi:hypothetical protein